MKCRFCAADLSKTEKHCSFEQCDWCKSCHTAKLIECDAPTNIEEELES